MSSSHSPPPNTPLLSERATNRPTATGRTSLSINMKT